MNKKGFKIEKKVKYLSISIMNMNCVLVQTHYIKKWNKV